MKIVWAYFENGKIELTTDRTTYQAKSDKRGQWYYVLDEADKTTPYNIAIYSDYDSEGDHLSADSNIRNKPYTPGTLLGYSVGPKEGAKIVPASLYRPSGSGSDGFDDFTDRIAYAYPMQKQVLATRNLPAKTFTVQSGTTTHTIELSTDGGGHITSWKITDATKSWDAVEIINTNDSHGRGMQPAIFLADNPQGGDTKTYFHNPAVGARTNGPGGTPDDDHRPIITSIDGPTLQGDGSTVLTVRSIAVEWDYDGVSFGGPTVDSDHGGTAYTPVVWDNMIFECIYTFNYLGVNNVHKIEYRYLFPFDLPATLLAAQVVCANSFHFVAAGAGGAGFDETYFYDAGTDTTTNVEATAASTNGATFYADGLSLYNTSFVAVDTQPITSGYGGGLIRWSAKDLCVGHYGGFQKVAGNAPVMLFGRDRLQTTGKLGLNFQIMHREKRIGFRDGEWAWISGMQLLPNNTQVMIPVTSWLVTSDLATTKILMQGLKVIGAK